MNQRGFTLVELAIVLVIIGVILGGVIKGQELVTNAKIKRLYRDYQQVEFAYFSYYDRYNGIPGDSQANAAANVNGLIDNNVAATSRDGTQTGNEDDIFWYEIRNQGFFNDGVAGITFPTNALGGAMLVENGFGGLTGSNVLCMQGITAKNAKIFDAQFDDGDGTTGKIRGAAANPAAAAVAYSATDTTVASVCIQIN